MNVRNRVRIVIAFTTLAVVAYSGPALAEDANSGGDSSTIQKSDNQTGKRRNRNRNNTQNSGSSQLGGSSAQQFQQALQGLQGNSNNEPQSGEPAPAGGQLQSGKKLKKLQPWQNLPQHSQKNLKKKHKHNNWQGWAIQFGGPAPFSAQWYNHHPQAWHHHHLDHDDAWNVATAAGVLTWLGWHAHPHHHHTVIYEPVPVETIYVHGQPPVVGPHAPGRWMILGVYSLSTGPGESETRMLELAIDKFGRLRGNYYDAIINASHTVTGRIDEPTQYVQWSLDSNKQLTFYAPLSELTQPQGLVTVRFPGGQQEQWQLTRMEDGEN